MQQQEWVAHIEASKKEGVTLKTYARRHGLAVDSLYYWRRKLSQASAASTAMTSSERLAASTTFVALKVAPIIASSAQASCTLRLGTHVQLEMQHLPSPEWLLALARTAGAC